VRPSKLPFQFSLRCGTDASGGICLEVFKMAKKTQAEKTAQNDETVKGNDDPMNDDEEPNFSDPEGFVDDITDEGKYPLAFFFHQSCENTLHLSNLIINLYVYVCARARAFHMRHA